MNPPEEGSAAPAPVRAARWTTGILTALAVVLLALVIRPFAEALFVAAVLAGALYPLYARLTARWGGRRDLTATVFTLAVALLVVAPVASLTVVLAREAADGVAYVRKTVQEEGLPGLVADLPPALRGLAQKALARMPQDRARIEEMTSAQGGRAASAVGGMVSATWGALVQLGMMLIAFYFLLSDGEQLVDWASGLPPLRELRLRQLLADFRSVSVAVLVSTVATAAVQGLIGLLGYLIVGLPHAFFFAVVTFVLGLVPAAGGGFAALCAAGIVFLSGRNWAALFLAVWAVVAVGLADNIIKPYLIRGRMQMHGAVIFFALLGGLSVFGPIGLLAGPLVVSFFLAVLKMWDHPARSEGPPEPEHPAPAL